LDTRHLVRYSSSEALHFIFESALLNGVGSLKVILFLLLSLLLESPLYADVLIKAKEAALPPADEISYRGISRGPGIKLISPASSAQGVSSPLNLKIVFEPHGGATIDTSTVEVVYLKSPSIDLTDRVKKGISEKGIELSKAEVPPGEHHLQIRVTDSNGLASLSEIILKVTK
jgi:hypothetical protein